MAEFVASLGMYDHPALQAANDQLWRGIAAYLEDQGVKDVPRQLDRNRLVSQTWADPRLLLAQSCAYPLLTRHAHHLAIVAIPVYRTASGASKTHHSEIVVRRDDAAVVLSDLQGRRAAINDRGSNTGMNLFRAAVSPFARDGRFFGDVLVSGSHHESAIMVSQGQADVAAIDSVTFAHLTAIEPALTADLRIIGQTPASPNLPFVTARHSSRELIALLGRALSHVAQAADLADARRTLLLDGFEAADLKHYAHVLDYEECATRAGYPALN